MASFGAVRADVYDRVSRSQYYREHLAGLTAHERHTALLAEALRYDSSGGGSGAAAAAAAAAPGSTTVTDFDALQQHHK
jgi:hypothetical protein